MGIFEAKKKQSEWQKESEKEAKELGRLAQLCMADEKFKVYKSRYQRMRAMLIQDMLACSEPDPIKFALQMASYQDRINALGLLLGSVEDDAKLGGG